MKGTMHIELKDIGKVYQGRSVLKGCSHLFEPGRLHALIGPNGSGKTTLLRICGLIEDPDGGSLRFGDLLEDRPADDDLRRRVTMVFSKPGLFNATVEDNAAYALKIRGIDRRQTKTLVREVLNTVGLWDKRDRNAMTLSAGEGQRLAIARAVVFEPEVILLDEPTASLDPANTAIIEDLVRGLIRKKDRTVVMATHNMFQARRLSDKVVFMHEGSLYDEGDSGSFFAHPKNEIARQFITGALVY